MFPHGPSTRILRFEFVWVQTHLMVWTSAIESVCRPINVEIEFLARLQLSQIVSRRDSSSRVVPQPGLPRSSQFSPGCTSSSKVVVVGGGDKDRGAANSQSHSHHASGLERYGVMKRRPPWHVQHLVVSVLPRWCGPPLAPIVALLVLFRLQTC